MASRGSCQSQTYPSVVERSEGADRSSPPRAAAKETGPAGSDQRREFLLREADAGQDPDGVRPARWRNTTRRDGVVRPLLSQSEPQRRAEYPALQAGHQVHVQGELTL